MITNNIVKLIQFGLTNQPFHENISALISFIWSTLERDKRERKGVKAMISPVNRDGAAHIPAFLCPNCLPVAVLAFCGGSMRLDRNPLPLFCTSQSILVPIANTVIQIVINGLSYLQVLSGNVAEHKILLWSCSF